MANLDAQTLCAKGTHRLDPEIRKMLVRGNCVGVRILWPARRVSSSAKQNFSFEEELRLHAS